VDFNDLLYIRYDIRPANPKAPHAELVKKVTGKDNPGTLDEDEIAAVERFKERQTRLSKALVRFWTWAREHPEDRHDDERMLCRLDSEMSRSGFPVVDESITGIGEAFVEVPK
jgi:hypothetical protein